LACLNHDLPCANTECVRKSTPATRPYCPFCPRSLQLRGSSSADARPPAKCDVPKCLSIVVDVPQCVDCSEGYVPCHIANCSRRITTLKATICDACIAKAATVVRLRVKSNSVPCLFASDGCLGKVPICSNGGAQSCPMCVRAGPPCKGNPWGCRRRCLASGTQTCPVCTKLGLPCRGKHNRGCRNKQNGKPRRAMDGNRGLCLLCGRKRCLQCKIYVHAKYWKQGLCSSNQLA
jgi:hypothetical protein